MTALRVVSSLVVLLAFVLVAASAPLDAGSPVQVFEPILPTVSPGGTQIAWVEGATSRVIVARPDGSGAHAVGPTVERGGVSQVTWIGTGIVVDSDFTLFLLTPDGRRSKLGPASDLAFSVGGSHLASGSPGCGGCVGPILLVDMRTGKISRLGSPKLANSEPALSPDGRRVTWAGPGGLWIAPVSGGTPRKLVVAGSCPQWSPDGRWIAYLGPNARLEIVPATGGRSRLLATHVSGCNVPGAPAWSPDSTRIAFEQGDGLAIASTSAGAVVQRSAGLGRVAGGFAWSADGSGLYASVRPTAEEAARDNCTALWLLDPDTLRGTRILNGCP